MFRSVETGLALEEGISLQKNVPQQDLVGETNRALEIASEVLAGFISFLIYSNIAINLLLAGSLYLLWSMVNSLQIIMHMPLFALGFPKNAYSMLAVMIYTINFE